MHRSAASLVCALANAYSSPCVEVQAYNLGPEKQSEVVPGQEMRLSESQALWGLGVGVVPDSLGCQFAVGASQGISSPGIKKKILSGRNEALD